MLLKSRLNPGGLAVTWAPTNRVIGSFVQAFPYVLQFGSILFGSAEPIEYQPEATQARVADPVHQA